ncbi:TonB-dependent siderophore receptor [Luteimonas sp. RIT-PG2_3]
MLTPRCRSERRRTTGMPKLLPLAAALLIAQAAHAQSSTDSQEAKDLDTVEVTATRVKMAEIGGYASTLRETPQSVTVIDRQQLETQNLFTLDDVMMKTPGVVVMQETSDEHYYYIRGQEVNSFQWDGITMESFAWLNTSPNMAMFDQVQILRGANGVLNAAKSFGSVNLIRKRPKDHFALEGSLSYGSWSNLNTTIDVTGPLTEDGRLRGRAVASYGNRDYFYDIAKRKENLYYAALEYDLSDATLLTLTASDHQIESTPFVYGMPRFTDGGSLGLPRSTFFGSDWNHFDASSRNVYGAIEHKFENGWSIKFGGTSLDSSSNYKYSYVWGGVDRATGDGAFLYGNDSQYWFNQKAADLSVQGQFELFGRTHDLLIGSSYYVNYYGFNIAPLDDIIGRPVDVFNWDPRSVPNPTRGPWQYVSPHWRDDWKSVYGTTRLRLSDNLTATLGARATWFTHQWIRYDYGRPVGEQLTHNEDTRENGIITPYAGLVYDLNDVWSVYASYADIFTPQVAQTYEGDTLDPIIGANFELGIKGEMLGGRLNGSFAVFRVDKTNEAMEDTRYPPQENGGNSYSLSSGKTRSQGYELELTGRPTRNWSISGGYTRNTTNVIRADAGVGQPYATWVPKHMLRMWTDYTLPFGEERWSVGGNIVAQNRVTRPTNDPLANISQGSYAILGARVGYKINDNLDIGLNFNNLTDRTYYPKTGSSVGGSNMYGEPRNVMLTLRGSL